MKTALGLALALAAGPAAALPPSLSPGAVLDQMESALNAGNVAAFVAWFAPDGVVKDSPTTMAVGPEQIRLYAEGLVARNYHVDRGPTTLEGTRLRWSSKVTFDSLRALGVDHVDGTAEAVIEKGKVKMYQPAFSPGCVAAMATSSSREAEEFVRSFLAEVFNAGTTAKADEYLAPEFTDHAPFPGKPPTVQGFKDGLAELRAAMPDLKVEVLEVIASPERAVVRSAWTGTSKASYQGTPPTYRAVRVGAIEILRLKDGHIMESWRQIDSGELAKALGLFEAPAMAKPGEPVRTTAPRSGSGRKKGVTGGLLGWLNDL